MRACVPPSQARDLLIEERLVAPFRAFGEAMRTGLGEVVGLQLCRLGESLVYDVTMLGHDGHVTHVQFDARNGASIPATTRNAK